MTEITSSEWFCNFIDECKAIIVEGGFHSRWILIESYHALGKRILEENNNFERAKIYGDAIVKRIAESLGKSERTIYRSIQFVKKYPDLNSLPEGKSISWGKICKEYLPVKSEEKQKSIKEVKCPNCGFIFEATKEVRWYE